MSKRAPQFWLMKSEPDVYSIDDLERDGTEPWEGVRNYQARNFMREMLVGDWVLFYHSNAKPPGVAGLARVCREAYPDPTQFDRKSQYFDPKSSKDAPRWSRVDVAFVEKFPAFLSLQTLKDNKRLQGMRVTQKGQRLSVQPVEKAHFDAVLKLAKAKTSVR
jgi:predicted RNA-binding protein with PUA-like domain